MIKLLIDFLNRSKQKKEASEVVVSAETLSYETGLNVFDIIEQYQGDNIYLQEVKHAYKMNKQKHQIYEKLFDKDFLFLIKACETKGLIIGEIFRDYVIIREKIRSAKNKIVSTIMYPFLSYIVSSLIVFIVLNKMHTELAKMKGIDISFLKTIVLLYWPIIIFIGLLILIPLLKFPRKVPYLKNAYKELDAFQYLSSIFLILKSGLSMVDVYEVFKEKINSYRKDIEGILFFLKKYLSQTEIYAINVAVQTFKFETIFSSILKNRQNMFETKIEKVMSTVSTFLMFIVVIPLGIILFVMFKFYIIIAQMAMKPPG